MAKIQLNGKKIKINSKSTIFEYSSFHIMGESITFLSGDLTEKIKPNTKRIVMKIIIIVILSERLFIISNYLVRFLSGVVFS